MLIPSTLSSPLNAERGYEPCRAFAHAQAERRVALEIVHSRWLAGTGKHLSPDGRDLAVSTVSKDSRQLFSLSACYSLACQPAWTLCSIACVICCLLLVRFFLCSAPLYLECQQI